MLNLDKEKADYQLQIEDSDSTSKVFFIETNSKKQELEQSLTGIIFGKDANIEFFTGIKKPDGEIQFWYGPLFFTFNKNGDDSKSYKGYLYHGRVTRECFLSSVE